MKKRLKAILVSSLLISLGLSGCALQYDLIGLQRDMANLQQELYGIERKQRDLSDNISQLSQELKAKDITSALSSKREAELNEKMSAIQKGLANTGADLNQIRENIQRLEGTIEENKHFSEKSFNDLDSFRGSFSSQQKELSARLKALQERLDLLDSTIKTQKEPPTTLSTPTPQAADSTINMQQEPPKPLPPSPSNPQEIYDHALSLYREGKLKEAREEFKNYLAQFPQADLASNAQFWLGQIFYQEQRYKEAIIEYDNLIKKYPKSSKVPDALLKEGMAFEALGEKKSAEAFYKMLITDYPKSPQAEMATLRLKAIQ